MADALLAAARAPGQARAVLITGEGRSFMAGGDVSLFEGDGAAARIDRLMSVFHDMIQALAALPLPVVALAHGAVAGAGVSMALAADLVRAADDAQFILAYSRLGANPDGGSTYALPRAMGLRRALGFALLEETLGAEEARQAGLVNQVLPAAEAQAEALRIAERLAAGPTAAFGRTKALLRGSLDRDLAGQLDVERANFIGGSFGPDFAEGVAAFLGKRRPNFMGR
jgi:2-(1,2-epoxy-1,2-dihydrophenyl)acetyl-CoA isomerase